MPWRLHRAVLVALLVEVHRREHAVAVPVEVTRGLEQLALGDVRGVDELVARLGVALAGVVLQLLADDPALGVEHREAGADLVGEAEQVELGAEAAVVAALGLGEALQVGVLRLLRLPRRAVDALQLRVVLVAAPVGRRGAQHLERRDVPGGRDVRAAAQVAPHALAGVGVRRCRRWSSSPAPTSMISLPSSASLLPLRSTSSSLNGSPASSSRAASSEAYSRRDEPLLGLDDLAHRLLERLEVLGRERPLDLEVVVEAVGDRRADPELGVGEQLLHRLGQHVRGGVADHRAAVLGVRRRPARRRRPRRAPRRGP